MLTDLGIPFLRWFAPRVRGFARWVDEWADLLGVTE